MAQAIGRAVDGPAKRFGRSTLPHRRGCAEPAAGSAAVRAVGASGGELDRSGRRWEVDPLIAVVEVVERDGEPCGDDGAAAVLELPELPHSAMTCPTDTRRPASIRAD